MLSLFSTQPLSCSLLFSQQEFLSSSCSLNKNASAPLVLSTRMLQLLLILASHQEPLGLSPRFLPLSSLLLASHQEPLGISPRVSCSLNKISSTSCSWYLTKNLFLSLWHLTKDPTLASHHRSLALGISPRVSWPLTKNSSASLLLASHQEPLGISPRVSCSFLFSQQECCNFLVLGISPRTSWHLTKNLLLSQQDCCCINFITQEWVRPLALINLMREGEEFSDLMVEIRSDGWLRFGVSSLTLTLIIKLSFNLHLTN
jgi:hypothetical protein